MENLNINTTQNVQISGSLAGVGYRILASLLDFIFVVAYVIVVSRILILFSVNNSTMFFISFIPVYFYNLFSEIFLNGQTFGKKIFKLKVVRVDGGKPRFYHYLVRWIFRLIDIYMFMGGIAVVSVALTKKTQRIGDIAAGTTVIRLKQKTNLSDIIFEETDENYEIVYNNVNLLSDNDIDIIKEVIAVFEKYPTADNIKLVYKAKERIEKSLNIEKNEKIKAQDFLKTIVKDYNHYYRKLKL